MILPIYLYDNPILRKELSLVTNIDDEILRFAQDMHETMQAAEGIGLAANQVGKNLRVIAVDLRGIKENEGFVPVTMINPVINSFNDITEKYEEGCLSLPELRADVFRPTEIEVSYFDTDTKEHSITAQGLFARVIQHEIDHLNGIYFFDRISPLKRSMLKRRLLDIKRGNIEADYLVKL